MWFRGTLDVIPGRARAHEDAHMKCWYAVPGDESALISDSGVVIHYLYDDNSSSYIVASKPSTTYSAEPICVGYGISGRYVVLKGPFRKGCQDAATQAMADLVAELSASGQLIDLGAR